MQVLVEQHRVALRVGEQGLDGVECAVDQGAVERATGALPVGGDLARPPAGFLGQGAKGLAGRHREATHQVDQNAERKRRFGDSERLAGPAAFKQQRVMPRIVCEEAHGSLAGPGCQGVRLVLIFAANERELQDGVGPVRPRCRQGERLEGVLERLFESQLPGRRACLDGASQRLEPGAPPGGVP